MIEPTDTKPKRKGRGPGKKPRLVCTSIRLSATVMEYFNKHYPHTKQAEMRRVLADYVNNQLKTKELENGTEENDDVY